MSMTIRPLSYALGAEITGIDLSRPLDDDRWAEIHAAWLKHIVLVFPGQKLTPEQQIAFGGRFGPLDDHSDDPTWQLPGYPQIYRIGNYLVDGKMSRTKDTGRKWHTDHSYTTRPTLISMLYARSVPPVGGTTVFSNMYMAYDTLSEKLKGFLDDMEAVHDFLKFFTVQTPYWKPNLKNADKVKSSFPPVVQPVVRTHPETGRKALYVQEAVTTRLLGLTEEEGHGLLDYLFRHQARCEFTYRHHYRVDDLVFWDNRCSLHLAPGDYEHDSGTPREMYRLTVMGEPCGRPLHPVSAHAAE